MVDSEQIKRRVVDQLTWDARVEASDIKVSVDGNKVNLTGTVPTFSEINTAEDITFSTTGVYSVENNLAVEFPTTFTAPTDSEIRNSVERFLDWNTTVNEDDVSVKVDGGVVKLEGTLSSYWEKVTAESEVQSAPGVIDVKSKLAVVPTEKISDEILAERVVDRIESNTLADIDNIDVKIKDGEVTLSGMVPSWYRWRSVFDAAQYTVGVKDVEDNLKIRPS